MRFLVVIIATLIGGWLTFDGTRALATGDYVTARNGELGPWSRLASRIGVNPRGLGMKWFHVSLGALWLLSALTFIAKGYFGWWAVLSCSFLTLWYLPLGTVLSVAEIILLFSPTLRNLK